MLINDIKSGMNIRLTHNRKGVMRDNKRGIIRVVEVEVPGQPSDVGSTYADEIIAVEGPNGWEEIEITPAQKKQLEAAHSWEMW